MNAKKPKRKNAKQKRNAMVILVLVITDTTMEVIKTNQTAEAMLEVVEMVADETGRI
jgi:hypothetical protein